MRTFRISLAVALVITFLLVKSHLDSIGSAQREREYDAGIAPDFVLEDGGAHIELLSKDQVPVPPVRSGSSSRATHSSTPTSKTKTYLQPTKPVTPTKWQPESIPVYVPGQEFWEDDDDFNLDWQDYLLGWDSDKDSEPAQLAPPKPKVTPKSDRIIVMGRTSREDTTWLEDELPE